MTMPPLLIAPNGALAHDAFMRWTAANAAYGHRPGPAHIAAIVAALNTMGDMAETRAAAKVFLSSLDPGVGKTQAIIHFACALSASASHRSTGMMVMVGRIDEAKSIASALDAAQVSVAIFAPTAKDDPEQGTKAQAHRRPSTSAQVLITTHQLVERRLRNTKHFDALDEFHYEGRLRTVRVWDEAWLPGETVMLARKKLMRLVDPLGQRFPALASAIDDLTVNIKGAKRGDAVDLPDFEALSGVPAVAVLEGAALSDQRGDHDTLRKLLRLSSATVRVNTTDGPTIGTTLVSYADTGTAGMVPLLVLDASGRVRTTYRYAETVRHCLERLPGAKKDYGPLRIGVWLTSGRKDVFRNLGKRQALLEGVAELISLRPHESWLIVAHKDEPGLPKFIPTLERLLPSTMRVALEPPSIADTAAGKALVCVIPWGKHMACNDYKEFPNVILAGTLFMRDSHNIALTHLSQDRPVADGFRPEEEIRATRNGELMHIILQALCRGRVRQLDGEQCGAMTAYIIASKESGIKEMLPDIFPGCTVFKWREAPQRVPKKLAAAIAFLQAKTAEGAETITYAEVQNAADVSPDNFARDVTGKALWKETLQGLGWELDRPQRTSGLVRCFPACEDLEEIVADREVPEQDNLQFSYKVYMQNEGYSSL
jgi:hypothetical protein